MPAEGLESAFLRVIDPDPPPPEIPSELKFMFNPTEYTIAKSAQWTRPQMKGGKTTGKPEFNGSNAQTPRMGTFPPRRPGGGAASPKRCRAPSGGANPPPIRSRRKS